MKKAAHFNSVRNLWKKKNLLYSINCCIRLRLLFCWM